MNRNNEATHPYFNDLELKGYWEQRGICYIDDEGHWDMNEDNPYSLEFYYGDEIGEASC